MGIKFNIKTFILTGFFLLLLSCEKEIDWQFPNEEINTIVIQSILTSEMKNQEVKLSLPAYNQNAVFEPVSGALVEVNGAGNQYLFTEMENQPGTYLSDEPFAAAINQFYFLKVTNDTAVYEASTTVQRVDDFSIPQFSFADTIGRLKISWIAPNYNTKQAMYEININWESLEYDTAYFDYNHALTYHYTFNTIDVNYTIFPPSVDKLYFPVGSMVTVKKYSLTDDYADFLRAMVAETDWQGSIFEEARGNLPGNISNGGMGYFTASSVMTTSIIALP